MARQRKEKGGFTGVLLKVAVAGASVYLLVAFVGGQIQVSAKQRELLEIQTKVQKQSQKNEELDQLMKSGDENAYIERVARESLGYVRPDERVFVDISGQ